jgi:drug/metabolite transporter (DMT)-like permease
VLAVRRYGTLCDMTAGRLAASLLGLAGIAWVVCAVSVDPATGGSVAYLAGLLLLLLGLAAFGYSLVTTAPLWLRAVVAGATPALGYVVWIAIWDGLTGAREQVLLVSGLVLLLAVVLGMAVDQRRARTLERTGVDPA